MEIIIGLTLVGGMLFLAFVAPIISWVRAARMDADLRRLTAGSVPSRRSCATSRRAPSGTAAIAAPAAATDARRRSSGRNCRRSTFTSYAASDGPSPTTRYPPWKRSLWSTTGRADADRAGSLLPALRRTPAARAGPRAGAVDSRGRREGWLEAAIGGRLLLYVGTVALVLGVAFFLKYTFDRNWITEWMRVVLGAAGGLALVAGGLRSRAPATPRMGRCSPAAASACCISPSTRRSTSTG